MIEHLGKRFLHFLKRSASSSYKAFEMAEHIRSNIENNAIICGEHTLKVTASFGVCSIVPIPGFSAENL